ncbi:MAG: RICIN domain-containing protein [Chloroflexota bacterium]
MQKLLYRFVVLIMVSIALWGCVDSTPADEQQNSSQVEDESELADGAIPPNTLIQLSDPLDEPEYYCIDVPGFRDSLDLDGALTVHTCKPNSDDEIFTINHPAEGQFYMPAYERCMEARSAEAGAELSMAECGDTPLQRFSYREDATIQLQSSDATNLCITAADEPGEPTGGPSHLRRDLLLQPCADVSVALSQWSFPGPTVP